MHRELRPVLENLKQALDAHEVVTLECFQGVRGVVPHLRVEFAGAIGQGQRKIRLARFLLTDVLVMNQERSRDGLVRFDLGHIGRFHRVATAVQREDEVPVPLLLVVRGIGTPRSFLWCLAEATCSLVTVSGFSSAGSIQAVSFPGAAPEST